MIEFKVYASGSKGNLYTAGDGQTKLMIECGLPWKKIQQALEFRTSEISACLVSHSHLDHCCAVKDLLRNGINCYMSAETAKALEISGHNVKMIEHLKLFEIGSWKILPFPLEHDVSNTGYLLANADNEKLLFITDSFYCRYKFSGVNIIACECNYSAEILAANVADGLIHPSMEKRLLKSHFSLEKVVEFLKASDLSQLKEIHLIHLSDSNSDEALFKKTIQALVGVPVYAD